MKHQGYNDRADEELGMRRGKASKFTQNYKDRRDEMKGENREIGDKTYGSFAKGGITKNAEIIEQFLDENANNSLGNITIHHSTIGGVMLLRNYGTLIAKRQGRRVYISNKTYSKSTSAIQNSIERLAEKRGLKVYRIDEDEFAEGGEVKKKGNEMLIGGIAGVLLGVFFSICSSRKKM